MQNEAVARKYIESWNDHVDQLTTIALSAKDDDSFDQYRRILDICDELKEMIANNSKNIE